MDFFFQVIPMGECDIDIFGNMSIGKIETAEAAFLTGIDTDSDEGRVAAAKRFLEWGPKEVIISHYRGLVAAKESNAR